MAINSSSNHWTGKQFNGTIANTDKPYVSSNRPGGSVNGTNTASLIQSTSLLDQRDIYKQLVDLQDDAEWLDFMWMAGKKEATSVPTYFSFFNDKLYKPITITTGASIAVDGEGTIITDQDSYSFVIVGDLIRVKTDVGTAVVRVKTKQIVLGAYQLTVTSVTNSAIVISDTTTGSAFSNAQVEGSLAPTARRWLVGKLGNQTQIFRNTLVITDVQNMSKVELEFNGKPYILPYEMIQGLQKHRGDISLAMWLGEASATTFAGATGSSYLNPSGLGDYNYQTTRGMDSYIETYGISGQTTGYATGVFTLPDLTSIEAQLIANRSPFEYMMAGSTAAVATISDFLKNLPSSGVVQTGTSPQGGVYSGRLNVDGREVDLEVEKFKHAGFTFNLKAFKVLSNNEVMAYTGSTVQKSIYFLPMGKVKTVGGGMVDYFRYRYLPQPTPGQGSSETAEIMTGGLAPTPTNQEMNLTTTWTSNMGLEVFAPSKFAKIQVNN